MKTVVNYTKLGNQFFFISNLTDWHFSCRGRYNEEWLKKTGSLMIGEKQALNEFKKIILKYSFKQYLGKIFLSEEDDQKIWKKLKKIVTSSEYNKIKEAFVVFERRFKKTWKPNKDNRIKNLEKLIKKANYIFSFLETFLGKVNKNKIDIIILFSPFDSDHTVAGGANLDENSITIELPNLKKDSWQMDHAIGVIIHEIAHLLLRKKREDIFEIIKEVKLSSRFKNLPIDTFSLVNEIICGSIAPFGYPMQKYSNYNLMPMLTEKLKDSLKTIEDFNKGKKINHYLLYPYLVWNTFPLIAVYFREKKKLNKDFIRKVCLLVKQELEK